MQGVDVGTVKASPTLLAHEWVRHYYTLNIKPEDRRQLAIPAQQGINKLYEKKTEMDEVFPKLQAFIAQMITDYKERKITRGGSETEKFVLEWIDKATSDHDDFGCILVEYFPKRIKWFKQR